MSGSTLLYQIDDIAILGNEEGEITHVPVHVVRAFPARFWQSSNIRKVEQQVLTRQYTLPLVVRASPEKWLRTRQVTVILNEWGLTTDSGQRYSFWVGYLPIEDLDPLKALYVVHGQPRRL